MMRWSELEKAAPDLAMLTRERFDATELVMMGTLRKNGWPRISPIEYTFWDSDLLFGGIWQSKKFLDIQRDNRVTVHSTAANKNGQEGDAKLYGRLSPLAEERIEPYWQHIFEQINWRPKGPSHVFTLGIDSASYVRFTEEGMMEWLKWPGEGWQRRKSVD